MNLDALKTLDMSARSSGMSSLMHALGKGKQTEDLFSEGDTSLAFETLAENAGTADKDAAKDVSNPVERAKARWALALYRDALYCHAGRVQARALGLHNALRSLYEGGRIGANYE